MTPRKFISTVKSNILSIDKNAEIVLFGSRARGDQRPDSDWDFLILTSFPESEQNERTIQEKLFYVELESAQAISAIIHSKKYWRKLKITSLYQNIAKEGKKI